MRKQIFLGIFMSWALFLVEAPGQFIEIGAFGGLAAYSGDLSQSSFDFYTQNAQPSVGAFLRAPLHKRFSARLQYTYARLQAEDAFPSRGLNFRTDISELTLGLEVHPWTFGKGRTTFTPYVTAGVGYFTFNPQGRDGEAWIDLHPLGTEGQYLADGPEPYDRNQFNLPVGVGLKFNFNEKVVFGVEWLGRKLFTDYLDDVSDALVNYQELLEISGPVSARMSRPNYRPDGNDDPIYRRGGSYDDWFHTLTLSLAFPIGGQGKHLLDPSKQKTSCYEFRK